MTHWVRALVYVVAAALAFALATGVGAMVALTLQGDVGLPERQGPRPTDEQKDGRPQQKQAAGGGAPTPEEAILEEPTAAAADAPVEPTGVAEATDPDEREADGEVSFVHRATDANSRGDYTYLDDPRINGDPDAVVLVSPTGPYERNIGVWFEPRQKKWAIFNQDRAAVPAGSAFVVVVPPADEGFVHRAAPPNTAGSATYLEDPLLDGEPDAEVSVTQNWNPGGGNGVYNDHPVGARYDGDANEWFVHNRDGARMPEGAAFNVAVSGAEPAR